MAIDRDEINKYLKTQEALISNLKEMIRNLTYRNISYSKAYTDKEKEELWNCVDSIISMITVTSMMKGPEDEEYNDWASENVVVEMDYIAQTLYREKIDYLYGRKIKKKGRRR